MKLGEIKLNDGNEIKESKESEESEESNRSEAMLIGEKINEEDLGAEEFQMSEAQMEEFEKTLKYLNSIDSSHPEFYNRAYKQWYRFYPCKFTDRLLQPFLDPRIEKHFQWLKSARTAQFLTAATMSEKLGISTGAYFQIEKNEELQKISLQTLHRVAEAMDCELVYAIRPKQKVFFGQIIWEFLISQFKPEEKHRTNWYAGKLVRLMNNVRFRRKQNWSNLKSVDQTY